MSPTKKYLVPFIIVVFGLGWLLERLGVISSWDVFWTAGLAAAGIYLLIVGGFNRDTFLPSVFLLICSAFSLARALGFVRLEIELPLLIIIFGVLLAIRNSGIVPEGKKTDAKS
jgi:hypothetical protein